MTDDASPPLPDAVRDRPAWRAFLHWVEGADESGSDGYRGALADGVTRTWGQLLISARETEDGNRRYDLRHVDDDRTPTDELTIHDEPAALRELRRSDAAGRYRPLTSAPTLRRGWALTDLDGAALCRAVETCYPASIPNWHREREGDLDVTHWRETAERQTGIYDLVDELAGDQVERLARACCVDSQCLKRRQWDESPDDALDVPRGDGQFPCREPCSLVVSAAREVALAEREDECDDLSLSAADRAQVERVLEAVATGEVDGVRDGDLEDGANRLRVRYLREKLFGDG